MLPAGARWDDIKDLSGEALNAAYVKLLDKLSKQGGIIGAIFLKAQNEIQDPAKLKRLVGLIDSETWLGLPVDVKGNIYEGLLARNAEDVKSGAGQYFTPRPADRGDGRSRRSKAASDGPRSRLRHRGLPARRLGAHEAAPEGARPRRLFGAEEQVFRRRYRAGGRPPRRDEPLSARHHRRRIRSSRPRTRCSVPAARPTTSSSPIRPSARSKAIASSATTAKSTASARITTGRTSSSPPRTSS